MNSKFKPVIMNPVQHSPWESSAPRGFNHRMKRLYTYRSRPPPMTLLHPNNDYRARLQQRCEFDRVVFKTLNKHLLTFMYPCIPEKEIDTAMALCKNNLSETMKLLQRVTKDRAGSSTNPHPPREENLPQKVKYIPTKYSDVQIVEPSKDTNMNIMEVNTEVLKIIETCDINNTNTTSEDDTITLYRADVHCVNPVMPSKLPENYNNSAKPLKVNNETKYPDTLTSTTVNQQIFWKGP